MTKSEITNRQKIQAKLLDMFHETEAMMSELSDLRFQHGRMFNAKYSDVNFHLIDMQRALLDCLNEEANG